MFRELSVFSLPLWTCNLYEYCVNTFRFSALKINFCMFAPSGVLYCWKTGKKSILLNCGCIIRTTGCRYPNRGRKLSCRNTFFCYWLHFSLAMSNECSMDFSLGSKCPPRTCGEYSHHLAHDKALCYGAFAEIPSSACSGQLLIKFLLYSLSNVSCWCIIMTYLKW